jgi:hypothetical protein
MLTDEQVMLEIMGAGPGSDIHGLVEKVAYFLHLRSPGDSALGNWSTAQNVLLGWSGHEDGKELRQDSGFGEQVHGLLNNQAYRSFQRRLFFNDPVNFYADWMTAQHELGKQVLWQQLKIVVPLYPGQPFRN